MDSPERRAPIKPNWDGIMASPGSAAFMDLCDTLSPIRPVPTFHASTFNELNQIRSPASPNFPTRRLKEKRLANSSAAALLLAATTDEAPKTPGLLKREPLRQTFGRNLSRMDDPSTALFAGQTTAEAPTSAAASKQVLVMQEGGSVGDCESKLVMKGAREDSVLGATSSLPAQQGQPDSKPPPPKKEQIEGATRPEGSKGGESEAKPASLGTADGGQKASGSKRERDEPQSNAESMAPQAAPPAFLKSLKAAADSAAVIQPPESKRGKVNASSQVADTILAVPTPNPYKPSSAGPPSSEQAKEVVALPVASPAVLTKPTGETGGQEADQKKAAERAAESGPEQQGTETGLHRELSFAVKQSGPGATEVQVGAAESNSQAILPVPVSAIAELTPPTPQVMAALKDNLEVRPRQTRSRTMEKSDGLGSKERAGGAGIVPGVLPKGKRSASNRKKSRFLSGGEDSSAAEDAGVSSDDTERTVSADGAGSEEGTQKLQPGEHGCVAGANISGEDEAGSSPSKVGGSGASEYKQGAAEGVPADQENVEQLATTSALREDPNGAAKEAGVAAQASPEAPEPSLKAIAPESARHASPPRSTVLPQLKGVRSPRKGLRRGQETPPKAPANAAPPPGGAKQQNTEEDVAQLLVELSEGRTPEKVKRRLIGEEATPTSGLERKRVAVESVPAATEGVEGAAAGSGRTNQVAKAVKVEAASADVQIVSGAAVSCEQGATPRSVAFQEAKNGTSSPGALGGNTGRARRLDFDADAARRQSLTAQQDHRLSLEAQGSWPGFSAVQNSPAQSPVYISVANGNSTPEPMKRTPQSGQGAVGVAVKQEEEDGAWLPGQKRENAPDGGEERAAKRERVSFSDGAYQDAKDASDATAVALSAAMGALSACHTPATCQPTSGRPNQTPVQVRPAQAPVGVARPSGGAVRKPAGNERTNQAATPVAMHNAQASSWPVVVNPGGPTAYQHGNLGVTPRQAKQGYVTPPPRYAQPAVRPQGMASPLVTSATGATSAAAPFNPNVSIVPKPLPLPAPVRAAKPLNLARLGAGLSAGTVVRVTPGVGPANPDHQTHFPPAPSAMPGPTGPPGKRASFPPTQRPQAFTSTRFPGYSHYTPSYQKALPRLPPPGYGAVSMPFGQAQGPPPPGMSPAVVQRQKMEAAIERKPAQPDPLSEIQLDLDLEMDVHESPPQQPKKPAGTCKRCHCKKSRCLKLYCECFAANVYCTGCDCLDCQNRPEFEDIVMAKKEEIERKDPHAFAPKIVDGESPSPTKGETPASGKHKKGCHCKKSMCQKKYCECFQANVACTDACRCENCANEFGTKDSHSHGPHGDHAGGGCPAEAAGMRSPATPGFGRISIQRTFPGGGKMVAKKQSLDPHGDDISVLDFPHHHPTKEKRPETPPKPEPATSAPFATSAAPATSAGPATSAKGRGRKKDAAKGDLKTVRENNGGAAEQTSSGVFPSISSSPARWSLASPDPSPASRSYPTPLSPPDRRGSDTTEFLHLPASPSPSFGSGPLLRTGTGMGGTPLSRAKVRSTPLGAVIWNPAEMAADPAERRNSGQGVYSPAQRTPGVSSSGGMLKLSNLSGMFPPNAVQSSALEEGGASEAYEGSGFDPGCANPGALTCDESVDMDGQDPLAESFFMEPCDYGVDGDLYTYDPGQMDLPAYAEDVYGEAPKESVPVSPPPKTQRTGPSFVSLKNLSVGSGRQYNEDPDDPSAALLSPQDGKRRRLSAGGGRVSGQTFDEATPIRMSKTGSPTKVMAPGFDWGGSPGSARMVTPGKKSLNLSMLPSLPTLPARLSGGEGSGLVAPDNVAQG